MENEALRFVTIQLIEFIDFIFHSIPSATRDMM